MTFQAKRLHTDTALVVSPVDARIGVWAGDIECLQRYRSVG
jgi:hypothetical protein